MSAAFVSPEQLTALQEPPGAAALAAAAQLGTGDPLASAAALRRQGIAPELASAALSQTQLRAQASGKFGADAARMFFTRAGLEQATRGEVAARRAQRLTEAGVRRLTELGCGIGADTIALARAGIEVTAVEADPATAAVAVANLAALGLDRYATVRCQRAETVDLSGVEAVFCDPARRSRTGRRTFDPASFSPPWSFVHALPARVPRTVLKLAPGLDHALIPPGAEAQWVAVDRSLVELTIWPGPLAQVPRRATLLGRRPGELTGTGTVSAPVGPVRGYLYDPDPAVVRAGLVAEFAAVINGRLADSRIAYVYADDRAPTPYGRCLAVLEAMPFSLKRLRAALRRADVGQLEVMKRGSALDPDQLRRQLRLSGSGAATLVLTRVADAPTALLCRPIASPGG